MIKTLQKLQRNKYLRCARKTEGLARQVLQIRRALLSCAAAGAGISVLSAAGALAAQHISVRLNGDILPVCALLDVNGSGNQALALDISPGDITNPGTREFKFMVDCNTPFEYRLEAQYGALALREGKSASAGLAATIPYHVAVHIPTSGAPIDDRCEGEDLRTEKTRCQFSNSGDAIALKTTGKLTFAWTPKGTPLAGQYNEQMTLRVTIKP
jgi:hypothetical protein